MLGGRVVIAQRENAVEARNQSLRAAIGKAIGIPNVAEVCRQVALTCSGSPAGCRLDGADALVRLDVKRLSADTAHGTASATRATGSTLQRVWLDLPRPLRPPYNQSECAG
jgi:hypothetical protein